jgi:hypothetical protein
VHTRRDELATVFDRLATAGIHRIRWFMLCDGRAGIQFAPEGTPLGLDDQFFVDADTALAVAQEYQIQIMFVLLDFLWCRPARSVAGVQLGGRENIFTNAADRAAFLDRVLRPIFERYGNHRNIAAWDIINEPEWVTRGLAGRRPSIDLEAMHTLVHETASLIHTCAGQPVTLGSASARWLSDWRDVGLDFYQAHWYEHLDRRAPLARPVQALGLDRSVLLGEVPTRVAPGQLRWILDTALASGYSGAFLWSVLADDSATNFTSAAAVLQDWTNSSAATDVASPLHPLMVWRYSQMADRTGAMLDWKTEEEYWRTNYANRPYIRTHQEFDYWRPAYRYGYDSAMKYPGKTWNDVEMDVKSGWDRVQDRGEAAWEHVKDAVRDAWNRVTGNR